MHKYLGLALVTSLFFISGCSSNQYSVTYDSTPQSAMVVCAGQSKGYTPITLYYPKTAIDSSGNLFTAECIATWTSGATAYFNRNFDTTIYPDGVKNTVQRPNVDGYSTDAQMDYQKKSDDAAQKERNYDSFNNSMQQMRSDMPKTTYCNQIGTQVICNTY